MTGTNTSIVPSKKIVYIILVMFLFVLLAFIAYCFLAAAYPDFFFTQTDELCQSCENGIFGMIPLPLFAFSSIGAVIGHYVGGRWWHFIYMADKRHRNYKTEW